jgi:hypothetical protein
VSARLTILTLLALATVAHGAATADPGAGVPDGWALLAAAAAARGPARSIAERVCLVVDGEVHLSGNPERPGQARQVWSGGRFHGLVRFPGGVLLAQGVDGSGAHLQDPARRRATQAEAERLARMADLQSPLHPRRHWSRARTVGLEQVRDTPAWRVDLRTLAGAPETHWFAVDGGLPIGGCRPGDRPGTRDCTWTGDWRPVGGVLTAHRVVQQQEELESVLVVERASTLCAEPPPPPRPLPGPVVEVSVSRWRDLVVVPVQLGADDLQLVLDTGANTTVLPPDRLPVAEPLWVPGGAAGGDLPTLPLVRVPELAIGERRFADPVVVLADLSALFGEDGPDGILGADILQGLVVDVFPAEGRLVLGDPGALGGPPPGTHPVALTSIGGGLRRVSGAPSLGEAVPLLVDTGAARSLLSWPVLNALGFIPGGAGTRRVGDAVGADGRLTPIYETPPVSVDIDGTRVRFGTAANLPAAARMVGPGRNGVLGADLIWAGPARLDGPGDTLWLSVPD